MSQYFKDACKEPIDTFQNTEKLIIAMKAVRK